MTVGEQSLPRGWIKARLGDLIPKPRPKIPANPDSRLPFIGMDHIEPSSFSLKGHDQFARMKSSGSYFEPGDVLYGRLRPYLNKVHCAKFEGVASAEFIVLPSSDCFDSDFIKYLIHQRKFVDYAMSHSSGDRPRVKFDDIADYEFPLPPLNEQRRIVEKIETLFARLDKGEEALREVQRQLSTYRQLVLKAAVTGQLTADWRAQNAHRLEQSRDLLERILQTRRETWKGRSKYKEPVAPDTSDLPDLPEGWVWASLDELSVHLTSGSRDWKKYYGQGKGIFILAQNVRPMNFDLSQKFMVDPPPSSPDALRSEVRRNDILITIVGANTGDVCRFPNDARGHYVCQSVALLRLADSSISPFVEMYLSGKGAGRDQLDNFIYGAGRPHLSFEQIRTVAVPIPSNEEQAQIMLLVKEAFERVSRIDRICKTELTRSAALRQSILKDAFAGRLVPQDPNDESAADLVARIKENRDVRSKRYRRQSTRKLAS
ncbi:restriction endonuclease subunit S [Fodinicurvata sediminis]|uniref:restriction endonuclease subunit S n=1 Tax=Fodinicurvata sediminis TaxID=1121832 RepID=UPI0004241D83|nr:restriction endonuclease subunit S [Fodinicurvata sediminis]